MFVGQTKWSLSPTNLGKGPGLSAALLYVMGERWSNAFVDEAMVVVVVHVQWWAIAEDDSMHFYS